MATPNQQPLKKDSGEAYSPQHWNQELNGGVGDYEYLYGKDNHSNVRSDDGKIVSIGATADAESSTGDGSAIAILKNLRTRLGNLLVTLGGAFGASAVPIAGSDGTNARAVKTDTDGNLQVNVTGSLASLTTNVGRISVARHQSLVVAAGANASIVPFRDVSKVSYIVAGVYHSDASHNYCMYLDEYGTGTAFQYTTPILGSTAAPANPGVRVLSNAIAVRSIAAIIVLKNQDAADHTYVDVEVFAW